jgi:ABC-type antimicrobial peptide transport system permease subunit
VIGDLMPGANAAALEAKMTRAAQVSQSQLPAAGARRPAEVDRLRQTSWFPAALAALLGFLALVAVGHALVTGTRRRRGELALLKGLGFERHQLQASIACQATLFALLGLIIGMPLGIATGVTIWHKIANSLGIVNTATTPVATLALVPLAIIAVNVIAFFPARAAARIPTGLALRSE